MNESQKSKNTFNDIANNAGQTLLKNRTQNWFFTGTVYRTINTRTQQQTIPVRTFYSILLRTKRTVPRRRARKPKSQSSLRRNV